MTGSEISIDIPSRHVENVFGQFDHHVKKIEETFRVNVVIRDDHIKVLGEEKSIRSATSVFTELLALSEKGNIITEQNVDYILALAEKGEEKRIKEIDGEIICHTMTGKPVSPKTIGQKEYVRAIKDHMIVFGIGPAGTGKTYLAMAMAITAFKNEEVSRIVLTRPAIEAGEKLGFLPGDLQSKVDPYLRPLYDALFQIMGPESFQRNMDKGLIEVAPLAYMRGRTLENAYIILDEAQNTTPAQMKMFLTRIGFGSKAVITGDRSQKDLNPGTKSGLDEAVKILKNVDGIAISELSGADVVRHPLVQRIVKAYDDYEAGKKKRARERT